jgi:hypothetical protein
MFRLDFKQRMAERQAHTCCHICYEILVMLTIFLSVLRVRNTAVYRIQIFHTSFALHWKLVSLL